METYVLESLEPKSVFHFFEELCRIPHESGNMKPVSDWVVRFAQKRGLRFTQDGANNVVIWKNAAPGYEDHPAVMLQGHLDMVCVKDPGTEHDFARDSLDLYMDGDWIKARGTTLGGDNGVAVAMMMALLDDDSIPHPPIEAVFTVDEEVGLLGAAALDCSQLSSRLLINLDSEAEGVLTVGCAGGARCDAKLSLPTGTAGGKLCTISIGGLQGGHSGGEIHRGFANANKLLAQCLEQLSGARLVRLQGGKQDNAIPNCAEALAVFPDSEVDVLSKKMEDWFRQTKTACSEDPGITFHFTWEDQSGGTEAISEADSQRIIRMLLDAPNGVQAMEPDLPGQVRTSLNLGVLRLEKGNARLTWSVRSSQAAEKEALIKTLKDLADGNGASFERRGDYPAWEYRKDSLLRDTMVRVFRQQYGKDPVVETIHAGLECGLFSEKMPGLDAVSCGPDLLDIHSPRERMSAASVQRTWRYLLAVLAAL